MIRIGARHRLAAQQIPTVRVAQRQRLATGAVAGRKQPLKSMHHTSLAAPQCANGVLDGELRRRNRRLTVKPSRSNSVPMLLAAGHAVRGARRSSQARTFTVPNSDEPGGPRCSAPQSLPSSLLVMKRRSRLVEQTRNTAPAVARKPFVAGLPAHPKASANRRKQCSSSCRFSIAITKRIRSSTRRSPSIPSARPSLPISDLLPMSPVYSVTHVAGLDHPTFSPRTGDDAPVGVRLKLRCRCRSKERDDQCVRRHSCVRRCPRPAYRASCHRAWARPEGEGASPRF